MKYLKSYSTFKSLNESFYYKSDDLIENLFRAYYDLFLNLKDILLHDDYKLEYYSTNIFDIFVNFSDSYSNKFTKKDLDKLESEVNNLKDKMDPKVFEKSGLGQFEKLKDFNTQNEENNIKIKKIFNEIQDDILNNIKSVISFCKSELKKHPNWEIIHGLYNVQSEIDNDNFKKEKYHLQIEFLKLQEWVKKDNKKILITLDGRDAAGKGGIIEKISENLDKKYCRVESFGIPDEEEHKNWFKRYKDKLPKEGEIVFFDRSWYTRAYVEAPMGYCNEKEYSSFMDDVMVFEDDLQKDGIDLVKVWLSVDQDTQKYRFDLRKANPLKYWKFSKNDEKILNKWDDFTSYINKMLKKCNKRNNPWIVTESNDDRKSTIDVMKSILKKFNYPDKKHNYIQPSISTMQEKMKMNDDKYLFLDVDGVVIPFNDETDGDYHKFFNNVEKWSKQAIETLNEIWKEYQPKIVIISSYKRSKTLKEIQDKFKEAGFVGVLSGELKDVMKYEDRFENIGIYVKNKNIDDFIIIDDKKHDIDKIKYIKNHWLNLKSKVGLKLSDIPAIKDILEQD